MRARNGASAPASTPGSERPSSSLSASSAASSSLREPEARQLEPLGLFARVADRRFFALAALDRRAERIAQERDVAIERRARAAELVLQMLQRDRIARGLEQPVQRQDAFVAVHRPIVPKVAAERTAWCTRGRPRDSSGLQSRDITRERGASSRCMPAKTSKPCAYRADAGITSSSSTALRRPVSISCFHFFAKADGPSLSLSKRPTTLSAQPGGLSGFVA